MAMNISPEELQKKVDISAATVNEQIDVCNKCMSQAATVLEGISGTSAATYLGSFKELELCLQGIVDAYSASVAKVQEVANKYINWDASKKSNTEIQTGTTY